MPVSGADSNPSSNTLIPAAYGQTGRGATLSEPTTFPQRPGRWKAIRRTLRVLDRGRLVVGGEDVASGGVMAGH
jgi:hypothetical protein